MVENQNRYIISDKKFGYVNWLGFFTLYKKEILQKDLKLKITNN